MRWWQMGLWYGAGIIAGKGITFEGVFNGIFAFAFFCFIGFLFESREVDKK